MQRSVPAVAAKVGEIDAADEGNLLVDDDDLLVMAVQEALVIVDGDADAGVTRKLPAVVPDVAAGRGEYADGRAGPEQHAHAHTPRDGVRQELTQRRRRLGSLECEMRRRVPTCDPDRAASAADRLGDGGEHLRAVDE